MSSSSDDDNEILASRGLSEVIRIRGFTPHGYRDRSRDTLKSVDLWDLDIRVIPKNKRLMEYIMYDYKKDLVPALSGSDDDNHTIGIQKDQRYYDSEVLYLPFRLRGTRFHNVPESELDIYRDESKEEGGILWVGAISAIAPVRELMEKTHPLLMQASHVILEDHEATEQSEFNNDPANRENYEIYYKPAQNCGKWDCPLCRPLERFGEAWRKANKHTYHYLLGLPLDHPQNVKYDKLMHIKNMMRYLTASTMITMTMPGGDDDDSLSASERIKMLTEMMDTLFKISKSLKN